MDCDDLRKHYFFFPLEDSNRGASACSPSVGAAAKRLKAPWRVKLKDERTGITSPARLPLGCANYTPTPSWHLTNFILLARPVPEYNSAVSARFPVGPH
jgi:hypothetical protein